MSRGTELRFYSDRFLLQLVDDLDELRINLEIEPEDLAAFRRVVAFVKKELERSQ